jgi:hypothetical protein
MNARAGFALALALGAMTARAGADPAPAATIPPRSADVTAIEVGAFSRASALPQEWQPLEFPKIARHSEYAVEPDGGRFAVHARSSAAASGLIRRIAIDLHTHPILTWRWKVDGVVPGSDPSSKAGDDYAARIYIAFRFEPEHVPLLRRLKFRAAQLLLPELPYGALNYIWATAIPAGTTVDSAYAGDFVKLIAVQSGAGDAGRWIEERRDVLADYRAAFGSEPPPVEGVAIMTDTDNTGASASAWYGDIRFLPAGGR